MSRAGISIDDLRHALAPLSQAIEALKEEQMRSTAQVSEMYMLLTNSLSGLSSKLDVIDQNTGYNNTEPVKKPAAKKPSVKSASKTPAKAPAKTTASKKAPSVKKPAVKKGADEEESDEEVESSVHEEASSETADQEEKKSNDKPVAPKKRATKSKTTKKAPVVQKRNLNKIEFFNKMYEEDDTYFDMYLTPDVKKSIASEHAAEWKKLPGDELHIEKRKEYYHYMKNNHDDKLQALKNEYIESCNKVETNINEKESYSD